MIRSSVAEPLATLKVRVAAPSDRLPLMVAEAEAAGHAVSVRRVGPAVALPPEVDRAAFRIVQEALTNVRRHAAAGARVSLVISYDETALTLRIDDTGGGSGTGPPAEALADQEPAGNGIAGMRERAVALGGQLQARVRDDGGFQVVARLPIGSDTRAAAS